MKINKEEAIQNFWNEIIKKGTPLIEKIEGDDENYNITNSPEKTLIAGFSYGGLTSAFIGLKHPKIFQKILCQSGALYWKAECDEGEIGSILRMYKKAAKTPLDFYVTFGEFEKYAEENYNANQKFIDVLREKDYNFEYKEFMGGHTYMGINIELANGLIFLLGIENGSASK